MEDFKEKWQAIEPKNEPEWVNSEEPEPPFNDINSESAIKEIETGNFQVVDVRFKWEYDHYHIPGAILIPLPEIEERFTELDPDKKTLVVCEHGMRSVDGSCFLSLRGMPKERIFNLDTGMAGYRGKIERS